MASCVIESSCHTMKSRPDCKKLSSLYQAVPEPTRQVLTIRTTHPFGSRHRGWDVDFGFTPHPRFRGYLRH